MDFSTSKIPTTGRKVLFTQKPVFQRKLLMFSSFVFVVMSRQCLSFIPALSSKI